MRMNKLNKIDGLIGAQEVGRIIDQENYLLKKQKEKNFSQEVSDRNRYFLPLILDTFEQKQAGVKKPIYKQKNFIISKP